MKKIIFFVALFYGFQLFAQSEFPLYRNGLIYDETTIKKLRHIVDSLNLKHKTCEINKTFYSVYQTIGCKVILHSKNINVAKSDLEKNISIEDFIKKYPEAKVIKDVQLVRLDDVDYNNNYETIIKELKIPSNNGMEIEKPTNKMQKNESSKNTWVYEISDKKDNGEKSLFAFYFLENLQSKPMSGKYSKMISYSECLIDTNTAKFREDAISGMVDLPSNYHSLSMNEKEKLLEKLRSTYVIGGCSQDESPRIHAMNIALLSAETVNWEVFLRAHLDIMNDRFERMSDGSYAYARRKTYIKELEELDINVNDLILGIAFRFENSANNHYYGNIQRLGRAISESKNKELFENEILSLIEDETLDSYNRLVFYFLFVNYNHFLDEKEQKENTEKLNNSIKKLPNSMREN